MATDNFKLFEFGFNSVDKGLIVLSLEVIYSEVLINLDNSRFVCCSWTEDCRIRGALSTSFYF